MTRFLKSLVIQQKADMILTSNKYFKSYNWVVQPKAFQLKTLLTRPPIRFKRRLIGWLLAMKKCGFSQIPLSCVKDICRYIWLTAMLLYWRL